MSKLTYSIDDNRDIHLLCLFDRMASTLHHSLVSRETRADHKDMNPFQQATNVIKCLRPHRMCFLFIRSIRGCSDPDVRVNDDIGRVRLDGCCSIFITNHMRKVGALAIDGERLATGLATLAIGLHATFTSLRAAMALKYGAPV